MRFKLKLLKNNKGFSLAEALVATLILLMASSIVAAGIPSATRAYQKATLKANAEVALSTTISALRDELGTARSIEPADNDTDSIIYHSSKTGNISKISKNGNKIWLDEYLTYSASIRESDENKDAVSRPLVSKAMTEYQKVYVTYNKIHYNSTKRVVTFTDISVYPTEEAGNPLAKLDVLKIKVIGNSH